MGQPLSVLVTSLQFYGRYLLPLLSLALFAACGRVIQLGWSSQLSATTYWGLEMMVEGARLLLFLFIVQQTFATLTVTARQWLATLWPHFTSRWVAVLLSIVVFSLFAYLVNSGISWLAEQNALLVFVQRIPYLGSLETARLPMLIVFFLKNLTIIPFTLIWVFYGLVHLLQ